MSQEAPPDRSARDELTAAVAALRGRLPVQPDTQLVDFSAASDGALDQLLEIAEGQVAVVVLRLRTDAIYRGDGPPPPLPDLESRVMAHAGELVRNSVRDSDVVMRTGPLELAVVLVRAGPLEARAQSGRLKAPTAEQRFMTRSFEIRWSGRLGLTTYHGAAHLMGARKVLEGLFASAS